VTPNFSRDRFDLALFLSEELGRDVDLVFLNDCDPIIAMQVLANVALILNNDPACHLRFFMRTISEYLDFKCSRRIIEDHLLDKRQYA